MRKKRRLWHSYKSGKGCGCLTRSAAENRAVQKGPAVRQVGRLLKKPAQFLNLIGREIQNMGALWQSHVNRRNPDKLLIT